MLKRKIFNKLAITFPPNLFFPHFERFFRHYDSHNGHHRHYSELCGVEFLEQFAQMEHRKHRHYARQKGVDGLANFASVNRKQNANYRYQVTDYHRKSNHPR